MGLSRPSSRWNSSSERYSHSPPPTSLTPSSPSFDSGSGNVTTTCRSCRASPDVCESSYGTSSLLSNVETFWRTLYLDLLGHGYMLRPRYKPDWHPSWWQSGKDPKYCEDGLPPEHHAVIDAQRVSDGKTVAIKVVDKLVNPYEVEIASSLGRKELVHLPENHCVPILDVLSGPNDSDRALLVMPFLARYNHPPFETVGEVVDFFHQLFEGVQYMHHNIVVHRDITALNIMMDPSPIWPELFHPSAPWMSRDLKHKAKHRSRTSHPTKYYLTDFGVARKCRPVNQQSLDELLEGTGAVTPGSQQSSQLSDPFSVDVLQLGSFIFERFLQVYEGLGFMEDLVFDMLNEEHCERPTMEVVISRFDGILRGLATSALRKRLRPRGERVSVKCFRDIQHACRSAWYIVRGYPAIPTLAPESKGKKMERAFHS
ncbi:hypothetical protein K474DRAFT_1299249 [Panus rudis PR-1116 ss-1]|nr:hypothetical protein K474DRAFT_1299249 [Panus rudis PR-1116 ss-1]